MSRVRDALRVLSGGRQDNGLVVLNDRSSPVPFSVRQAIGDNVIRWHADKPQWIDSSLLNYDQHGYRAYGLIFACAQYLANATGMASLRVYTEFDDGSEEEVPDHGFRKVMARPNDRLGETRFMALVTLLAAISGFTVVEKERDAYGNVVALWPLRSDWLRAIPRNGQPYDWEYRIPGWDPIIIGADDAIHVTWADTPDMSPYGMSALTPVWRELQILTSINDFTKTFFDRGAMPLYFAKPNFEGAANAKMWQDGGAVDAVREKMRQLTGRDGERVFVSPGIEDIKPLGFNFNELAYTDLRKTMETVICTAFRVSPLLLDIESGLAQASYNNKEQARRGFYEDVMDPWWSRLDDAFTRQLLPDFDTASAVQLHFDTSRIPALKEDRDKAATRGTSMFSAGLISRHAAQAIAEIPPHGDDIFLVPFSAIAVPVTAPTPTETSGTTETPGEKAFHYRADQYIERDGRRYIDDTAVTERARADVATFVGHSKQQIIRIAQRVEPSAKRFLAAQLQRVITEYVGTQRSTDGEREHRALDTFWMSEDEFLKAVYEQWLELMGYEATSTVNAVIGTNIVWDMSNPYLSQLWDVLGYRIKGINETTRQDVEAVIREQLLQGASMEDVADALKGLYEETYNGRSMAIARTESQVGFNHASQLAYQASGEVSYVQMHDNPDCPNEKAGGDGLTCPERNGMVVHVSQMGHHSAGEHPNGTLSFSPILDRPLGDDGLS